MSSKRYPGTHLTRRSMLLLCALTSGSEVLARTRITKLWNAPADDVDVCGQKADGSASIHWNAVARKLVLDFGQDPVYASRTYALLSLAQSASAHTASNSDVARRHKELADGIVSAAVSGASLRFLSHTFPHGVVSDEKLRTAVNALRAGGLSPKETDDIVSTGVGLADTVISNRMNDGADVEDETPPPKGRGYWASTDDRPPVRPYWGRVEPLAIPAVRQYLPSPPPHIASKEFRAALADVREKSRKVTPEQAASIAYWADSIGTSTPSGHWNLLACNFLCRSKKGEVERARILALLNIAMFDAGLVCWTCKYKYWLARPAELDAQIIPRIKTPNFPSYTSGHSSFSGAASAVLSHFFAHESKTFKAMAAQASASRVLCGIHYAFDCAAGLKTGEQVGQYAVKSLTSSQALLRLVTSKA